MNFPLDFTAKIKKALITLCISFLCILLYEFFRSYSLNTTTSPITENSRTVNTEKIQSKPAPPLEDYAEIVERPLFADDRKPYVPEVIAAGPERLAKTNLPSKRNTEDYLLSAVIITDKKRMALIETRSDKKIHRINEGEELNGWVLAEINPSQVSLKKGGEIKSLELIVAPSPTSPTNRKVNTLNTDPSEAEGTIEIDKEEAKSTSPSPPEEMTNSGVPEKEPE